MFFVVLSILYLIVNSKGNLTTKVGLRSIITSVQIIAVYPKISQDWSPEMLSFFDAISIANLNIDLFSPECSVPVDYFTKWAVLQLIPVILGVSLCIVYVVAGKIKSEPVSPSAVVGAAFYLVITIYTYLVSNALEPFNCLEQDDGSFIMAFNPDQKCFEGAWNAYKPYFYAIAALYCFLIPGLILASFVYYRAPASRESEVFKNIFGIVSRSFKQSYFFWEFVFTIEKVVIVTCADMLSGQVNSQSIKVFIILAAIVSFFSLGLIFKPYKVESRNTTEGMWAVLRIVLLMSAFVFSSDAVSPSESRAITIVLITLFALYLTYSIGAILLHFKHRRKQRKAGFSLELQESVRTVFGIFPTALHPDVIASLSMLSQTYLRAWVRIVIEHGTSLRNIIGTATMDNDTILPIPEEQKRTVIPQSHTLLRSRNSRPSLRGTTGEAVESRDTSVSSYYSDDAILATDTVSVAKIDHARKSVVAPRTEVKEEDSDSDY